MRKELAETTNRNIKFDHFPISFVLYDEFDTKSSRGVSFKYQKSFRKISQIDVDSFKSCLDNKLSDNFEHPCNSFSQQLDFYNQSLVATLDLYAPVQTRTVSPVSKTEDPTWMDSDYKKERLIRRKLEKQWKRLTSKESYIKQRDYCVKLANSKTYYTDLSASTDNPSVLFKKV